MLHTCEKNAGRLAVIGIDLDRFKEINDLRGHAAGDEALRIVGKRLSGLATAKRFFARLGGDEFAAVIAFDDEQQLLELVARIEELLFLPLSIFGLEASTGASIGIAIFPEHGSDRERLMANADIAMYRAKKAPGQTTCFFEAGMESAAHARHELSHDLRRALERDQFQLYYQVQTSIETGQPLGYEALLRWKHPEKGFVSPAIFIPIAEETGDIVAIGEWVLRTACREAAKWTLPHKVSVNISPVQFSNAGLVQLLLSILMETQLPANRLELEITETAIIEDKVRTLHMLRQIRGIGVTVAIDDFGIGYSSLDTLRSFPFDKIKLDQSFIRELDQHPQSKAIIRAVMALGKSMSIPVLAEGVETMTQLRMLEEEGCHQAQGYLLGKPQPLSSANEPQPASIAPPRPTGVVSAVEAPRLAQN
jgi:diguanylate cyclase (GGDEF)-like protein